MRYAPKDKTLVAMKQCCKNCVIKRQDKIMSAPWNAQGLRLFMAFLNTSGSKSYVAVSNELSNHAEH